MSSVMVTSLINFSLRLDYPKTEYVMHYMYLTLVWSKSILVLIKGNLQIYSIYFIIIILKKKLLKEGLYLLI